MNNTNYKIYTLREVPWFIDEIAKIYLKEWGWYYSEEHNIDNIIDMVEYISKECIDIIYILVSDLYKFKGTVMLLTEEAMLKKEYCPMISYLYISENSKKDDLALSWYLINNLEEEELYTWVYTADEVEKYKKLGFFIFKMYEYKNYNIYILKKNEFVNR